MKKITIEIPLDEAQEVVKELERQWIKKPTQRLIRSLSDAINEASNKTLDSIIQVEEPASYSRMDWYETPLFQPDC